jgi:hypothetical protein
VELGKDCPALDGQQEHPVSVTDESPARERENGRAGMVTSRQAIVRTEEPREMHTSSVGRVLPVVALAVACAVAPVLAAKFKSTWKADGAKPLGFAGKKVVALVMTDDQDLQVSAEEALARELAARGVDGVPAYRLIPRPELRDATKAKPWVTRAGVAGVVAMRPLGVDERVTYTPSMWAAPYYNSFWNYYGYAWGSLYVAGSVQEETVVTVETLVFSVPQDTLLWAGVSEKTNPKTLQKLVAELVKESIKEMGKVGLVPASAR